MTNAKQERKEASELLKERKIWCIDVLRAASFLLVFLYHVEHYARLYSHDVLSRYVGLVGSIGWVGVDIFFAISGFLITKVIWERRDQQNWLKKFWINRFFRIVPALYLFLVVSYFVLYSGHVLQGEYKNDTFPYWAYYILINNIISTIFGLHAPQPFSVTWSLGVEEQFYLIWPLLFLGIRKVESIKKAFALLVLFSFCIKFLIYNLHPTEVGLYVFMPARIDGFIYGATLYLAFRSSNSVKTVRFSLIAFGALGILAGSVIYWIGSNSPHYVPLKFVLSGLIGAIALSIALLAQLSNWGKADAAKLQGVCRLGTLSYGLYLWHLLIIMLINPYVSVFTSDYLTAFLVIAAFGLLLSIAAAKVSERLVEKPAELIKKKILTWWF